MDKTDALRWESKWLQKSDKEQSPSILQLWNDYQNMAGSKIPTAQ